MSYAVFIKDQATSYRTSQSSNQQTHHHDNHINLKRAH